MLLNGNKGEMKEDTTSSEIVNSGTGMQPNGAALPSYTGAGATGRTGRGSASLGPGRLSVYYMYSAGRNYNRVRKH